MINNLLHLKQEVLLRSQSNWSVNTLPDCPPDKKEILLLIEMCHQQQFNWQRQLIKNELTIKEVQKRLCHLLIFKQELDEISWKQPPQLPVSARNVFVQDLLLYLGLCYLLQTGVQLFKGFCNNQELPSEVAISPYPLQMALDHLTELTNRHPEFNWLKRITTVPSLIKVIHNLQQHFTSNNSFPTAVISTRLCLDYLIHHLPEYRLQEQFYHNELFRISTHEAEQHDCISHLRPLLLINMLLFCPKTDAFIDFLHTYQNLLEEQTATYSQWESEHHYWQSQHLLYKTHMPEELPHKSNSLKWMKHLMHFCKKKKTNLQDGQLNNIQFDWNDTPQELVRLFHSLRINGSITLNGNNDMGPFVRKLISMFRIPKARGNGYLKQSSLMTYFKNINSEL